jgi:peptide/nickel transport system permease protein
MGEPTTGSGNNADTPADTSAVGVLNVAAEEEEVKAPKAIVGRSPGQLAWARLRRDRTARATIWVLGFFIFIAIFSPVIELIYGVGPTQNDPDLLGYDTLPLGYLGGMDWTGNNPQGQIHILGVMPGTGWDIFMQFVYGARTSLVIASLATLISVAIGVVIGVVAGYLGGWVDQILSWFIDYMLCFPFVLMAIAVIPIVNTRIGDPGTGYVTPFERMMTIIIVFSIFGWLYTARLVRGQVISLREREYVEAAKAAGASGSHIMFKQILPNLWAPILVTFSLSLPATVTAEAALSFLGIGVEQPTPDWGRMINHSISYMQADPAYLIIPGFSIWALVLSFNLFGDAMRDALDPKSSR